MVQLGRALRIEIVMLQDSPMVSARVFGRTGHEVWLLVQVFRRVHDVTKVHTKFEVLSLAFGRCLERDLPLTSSLRLWIS